MGAAVRSSWCAGTTAVKSSWCAGTAANGSDGTANIVLTHHELERQEPCQYSIPERCNRRADTADAIDGAATGYQFITLKRCHRRASMANTIGASGLPVQHTTLEANVKLNQKITSIVSSSNLNCILLKNVDNLY